MDKTSWTHGTCKLWTSFPFKRINYSICLDCCAEVSYDFKSLKIWVKPMVLILDGNLELGAHVRSDLRLLICLRRLMRSWAIKNWTSFLRKAPFSFVHACVPCFELPSGKSTMVWRNYDWRCIISEKNWIRIRSSRKIGFTTTFNQLLYKIHISGGRNRYKFLVYNEEKCFIFI